MYSSPCSFFILLHLSIGYAGAALYSLLSPLSESRRIIDNVMESLWAAVAVWAPCYSFSAVCVCDLMRDFFGSFACPRAVQHLHIACTIAS